MSGACVFCDPKKYEGRIVTETEHFVVIPTVGQISDGGHLLLFPREHAACLGAMPDKLYEEFDTLKERVQASVVKHYGPTLNFEHGIIGQTVPHAHLQMLPSSGFDMLFRLKKKYPLCKEISGVRDLKHIYDTRRVYLYYQQPSDEEIAGRHFAFYMDAIPQYLRLEAAAEMGRAPRGDWKAWRADPDCARIDEELMTSTVELLSRDLR